MVQSETCYIKRGTTNYDIGNNIGNTKQMMKVDIYQAIWEYGERRTNERNVRN